MQRQSGYDSRSRAWASDSDALRSRRLHQRNQRFFPNVSKVKQETQSRKSTDEHKLATQLIDITTNKPTKIGLHFPIILKIPRAYAPKTQKDRAQNPLMNLFSPGKTHKTARSYPPYTFLKIHCRHFMQNTINSNISKQKPHKNIQILTKTTTLRWPMRH